tara:strand:+ start:5026 stop:5604 length:579 start_codon:yes stop_codon:yes gene_type:complete
MSLKLTGSLIGPSAIKYVAQSKHRQTAVDYLIHGAKLVHEENIDRFPRDTFIAELEEIMPKWSVETLAQGAYVREFHLWEKEAKEYFSNQLQHNGIPCIEIKSMLQKKRKESVVDVVKRLLMAFDIYRLGSELSAIDTMRLQVNRAKHDPGVLLDDFVSIEQFWDKHAVVKRFWSKLLEEENYCGTTSSEFW